MKIDMRRVSQEHEEARRMDAEEVGDKLNQSLLNDHEIMKVRNDPCRCVLSCITLHIVLGDTFCANAGSYNLYSKGPSVYRSYETISWISFLSRN